MRSQKIYQVYSGNVDEENDSPGSVAFRKKKSATIVAKETAEEIADEYGGEIVVEAVKMKDGLMRYNHVDNHGKGEAVTWWYVVEVTLKD